MIIKCEECQTKFKLDDSKVTVKGVKVRCAKCKHVFTVVKEQPVETPVAPVEESPEPFVAPADDKTMVFSPQVDVAADPAPSHEFPVSEATTEFTPQFDTTPSFEISSAEDTFGGSDFNLSSLEEDKGFSVEQNGAVGSLDEMDFGGFDFGDVPDDSDKTMISSLAKDDAGDKTMVMAAPAAKAEPQGLDFSDDSMFGEVLSTPVEEPQAAAISFDFGADDFADSMGTVSTGKSTAVSFDSPSEAPFSLGEIDFGDELTSVAVQQVNPDELKPAQELLFAPLAEAPESAAVGKGDDTLRNAFLGNPTPSAPEDELPPLSISSRRKQSPLFTGLIAGAAILVIGAVGYFGYSSLAPDKGKPVAEAGKISISGVKAEFVKNKVIGDLLVMSGDAVNQYPGPRAALQVKGMVYDAKGQAISTKSAYCGNPLTREQLADMPLDKIEAAMTNQFGDSLANMEVAPGKAVPFVVVIANPPKEGKDYGVEPSGSTVATGKQP